MGYYIRNINGFWKHRKSIDEINADIVETHAVGVFDGLHCLPRRMATVEQSQHPVVEALDADAQPVDEL